jgi:ATP-binding cassette subfamily B protein
MLPDESLPSDLEARLHGLLEDGEEVVIHLPTDIGTDGVYGKQWLSVTSERLVLFTDGDGAEPRIVHLKDVDAARADALVGNGVFEVTTDGKVHQLFRYSNSLAAPFVKLAKAIEDHVKREKPFNVAALKDRDDQKRCPKCGRVLPHWTDICIACVKKSQVLLRVWKYAMPYRLHVVAAGSLMLLGTVAELGWPYLMKPFMDGVLLGYPNSAGATTLGEPGRFRLLFILLMVWIGLRVATTGMEMTRMIVVAWLGGGITRDVRAELYEHLQRLTLRYYDRKQSGALISRMTRDTDNVWHLIVDISQEFVTQLVTFVGIGVMLFVLRWQLAVLILIPAPLVVVGTIFFWRKIHSVYHRLFHRWARMTAHLGDSLSGVRVIKAFAQEDREIGSFEKKNTELFVGGYRAEKVWAGFFPLMALVTFAGLMIARYVGGGTVILQHVREYAGAGKFTPGDLTAFLGYLMMFYGPISYLCRISNWAQRAITAAERIFEVIDSEQENYDAPDAIAVPDIHGAIEFKDVTFGYSPHEPVLKNINVSITPGEMIGLVGHSGAGKSTFINLVCRFYDVDEGAVSIDGVDLRKMRLEDLRSQIGVVPQESFLFVGTVAENIAFGKPDATHREIIRAAQAANAHEFIMRMPDGYDTQVGERGARLSVGERQRVAIARAILHNPKILILDEATASVDTETEKQIQEALGRLVRSRTTLAIAHRLSTLRNAHRLLVLENGELKELGTHDALLEQKGVYAKLVEMQSELSRIKAVDG